MTLQLFPVFITFVIYRKRHRPAALVRVLADPGPDEGILFRDPNAPSSIDPASYFDWWPTKGTTEWVEYTFQKPATVSEVQVYWFDDTNQGEVRVPASWRILYRDGDEWKPVTAHGPYGVERDRYNRVTFAPLTTSALRLELTMQPKWSAGLQEWKVK